jgi:glutamate/tyrosine decarboxylase-like PLP-dependent enzyme
MNVALQLECFQDIIENSAALAMHFANELIENGNFELLAPIRLNNVCFTLKGNHNQEKVSEFLTRLNDRGKVFMTPTVYQNRKGIRASFVNWRTTENDVKIIMEELKETILDQEI